LGAVEDRPDYDYADGVEYHVFELDEGAVATAQVPALDGSVETTVEARREGAQIEVSVEGTTGPWSVLLRGVATVDSVEGGAARAEALGTRLAPAEDVRRLVGHL
jgi:alpha-D-xyloside xylohydrolase